MHDLLVLDDIFSPVNHKDYIRAENKFKSVS